MRKRIFEIIEPAEEGDSVSRFYDVFIMVIAVVSVVPMMFKPDSLSANAAYVIKMIDIVTVVILVFDYFMRWMTFDLKRKSRGRKGGLACFFGYPFTISAIIDMLAILPTIVPIASSLKFLRLLRLVKIFRGAKNLRIVGTVFIREGKTLLSVLGILALFIFVTGLFMFLVERDTFGTFIDALYWATAALTTIGYGDYYPNSDAGQLINAISAVMGIVVLAIPTGIIAAGYVAETQRLREMGVKSQRAIDTDRSVVDYAVRIYGKITKKDNKKKVPRASMRETLNRNPRIARYMSVMIGCMLFSCLNQILNVACGVYTNLDLLGPAAAAFFLEPAAGVIVGFVDVLCGCVALGNVSYILYLGDACLVSVVFGVVLARDKKITFKRLALGYVLMVFALFLLQVGETIFALWGDALTVEPLFAKELFSFVSQNIAIESGTLEYALLLFLLTLIGQTSLYFVFVGILRGTASAIKKQKTKKQGVVAESSDAIAESSDAIAESSDVIAESQDALAGPLDAEIAGLTDSSPNDGEVQEKS